MDRCHGKTKSGERCKRTAAEGEEFCSIHADQAGAAAGATHAPGDPEETGVLDTIFVLAAAGVIITVGLVLRRTFRLL